MSHYTVEQLRQRKTARRIEAFTGELSRLSWEHRELREEYASVAGIYSRHLERIKAKAQKNLAAMEALNTQVTACADSAGTPTGQEPPQQ
jgi:hypothetical protein